MVTLLEFLFQGFFEWVYGLILEIWNYFSSSLLNVMSLDFAYLKSHIPVMGDIQQIILAVGWALLLGNLVFQALRSMASGLGFEGEDPKLLFARTFVFGFLLLASPQICELVLGLTSSVIALLEVPDAINVQLVDGSVIGVFTASWILVIIFDLITMFMVLSLLLEVAERYMVLAMLTVMAPLAFAMGGSKSTSEIFAGWCRMFGSMCFLMATNIVFFKMLLSVVSTVPSFPDVFLWMVLIISIVKVAKKADEIITRIGLNPAITGNRSTLPGVIAYTVFRTALSMVTKGAAKGVGGALGLTGKAAAGIGKSAGIGKGAAGRTFKGTGKGFGAAAGTVAGGIGGAAAQATGGPRYGGGRTQTQQSNTQQENTHQNQHTQQNTSRSQTGSQQQNTSQEQATGRTSGPQTAPRPGTSSRRSSVPQGTKCAPSYLTPPSGQAKTEEKSAFRRDTSTDITASSTGFTGFHGPPSRGGGFADHPRGGGFSGGGRGGGFSERPRGGSFSGKSRGGGFSDGPRGSGFGGGTGAKTDTPRGGGTFGGQPSGTGRREGFSGTSRGGGFSKGTARGGGFSDKNITSTQESTSRSTFGDRGGGFGRKIGTDTTDRTFGSRGGGFGGTSGRKHDTGTTTGQSFGSRGGGFGRTSSRSSDTTDRSFGSRGGGFGKITSQASHKTEISQSGGAGTGKPSATKMSASGISGPQPGMAGTGPRSTQRPAASEPRHSRNTPPSQPRPAVETQRSNPVQQEQRQPAATGQPSAKGGGSIPRPAIAGTPPATKMSGLGAPGSQSGTAGMGTRSTRRPAAAEPRYGRNSPPAPATPTSGAQSPGPMQQEQRRASGKGKPSTKNGGFVSHPGTAGTAPGSRTPPGQKLSGGPSKQKPMRQTKRKEGPTSV